MCNLLNNLASVLTAFVISRHYFAAEYVPATIMIVSPSRIVQYPTMLFSITKYDLFNTPIHLAGDLTEGVVEVMRELVEARLDELLHRRGLIDDALHHVVDRLDLNGSTALAQLFLVRDRQQQAIRF